MRDYALIVRNFLIAQGFSFVFVGTEKPTSEFVPDASIFVAVYGGGAPQSFFSSGEQLHTLRLQVLVRGAPQAEKETFARADAVYDALRNASPEGTIVIRPLAPPIRLAIDGTDRYRASVNVQITAQE